MLQKITIQNYAIIDSLDIQFSGKLNIITGETGAGKSILMGALSLILGDRADSSVLLNREKKCVVEGFFNTANRREVKAFLKAADLDQEEELVVRREIGANGKSRAFVNDTPVNLEQLRQLSGLLVDLHRQFDTLELGDRGFQREVVDALAGHLDIVQQYREVFGQWMEAQRMLKEVEDQKLQFTREFDYNKFLYDELEEAGFSENELEDADRELKLLSNSEGIKSALDRSVYTLGEGEHPAVQQLKTVSGLLQPFAEYHSLLPSLIERLQSVQIELKDIQSELEIVNDQISFDPRKMDQLNDRIALGYKLQKKHGVQSTAELLQLKDTLEQKLQAVLDIDAVISERSEQVASLARQAALIAEQLHAGRKKQVKPLQDSVNKLLAQVGMPNARLQVQVAVTDLHAYGKDEVAFLFDANKSNRFEPIRKVASGGELSRLMLCIKSLVARSLDLPTLIFDEIDTGISGEAAKQVGLIMKDMARNRQLISITHQPQIAGKADAHFFVYKEINGDAIKTNIRLLSEEERITAIARMLSGEKPTAAALENAREMIGN